MEVKNKTLYTLINKPCKILYTDPVRNTPQVEVGIIVSIDETTRRLHVQHQQQNLSINLSDIIALRPIHRT